MIIIYQIMISNFILKKMLNIENFIKKTVTYNFNKNFTPLELKIKNSELVL